MVMCKPSDHDVAIEEEFSKLQQVLIQTSNDTYNCLKLLKKHLSDYDNRNGNHFTNTATRFMRTDMRNAKDTAMDLKHVAHDINKNQPSKTETSSVRNMMNSTARAMEALKATARNYDRENKQRMGVKGRSMPLTLNHQIKAAEDSLTPSLMERAKEKMHDVKEKIKGDKSDPAYSHHHEGQHHQQTAMP
ncbi:hypothetical protein AM588_10003897 [Phytophthora nicotianae]|uniref:Uncharacterized protein n=1 Tax=Phytophthora nicotianae TaxID=4792 RepID=A0A0W8CZP0_PHYNI|nr:hypothetical protein AM588_10003897 [Phytophthora nicotianae]